MSTTGRRKVAEPAVETTVTGLSYQQPPPLFGLPCVAGVNFTHDGSDAAAKGPAGAGPGGVGGAGSPSRAGEGDGGVGAMGSLSVTAGGASAVDPDTPPPNSTLSGNLFVAARTLFVYKQSQDPSLEQRTSTHPVTYCAYMPNEHAIATVSGRDVDVWCALTGMRRRTLPSVMQGNILCAALYAGGRRIVLGDAWGTVMSFSTLTGEVPGRGGGGR